MGKRHWPHASTTCVQQHHEVCIAREDVLFKTQVACHRLRWCCGGGSVFFVSFFSMVHHLIMFPVGAHTHTLADIIEKVGDCHWLC